MLTLYDQAAKSMKASSPKIAKALYDAMIEACQRRMRRDVRSVGDQRFQRFITPHNLETVVKEMGRGGEESDIRIVTLADHQRERTS